jgi:hypothetical protein
MKAIALTNKELRLLSNQLQNFNVGYTVQQIRSLDKVIQSVELVLQPFNEGLNKILSIIVSQVNEKEKAEGEATKQKKLEEYLKTDGDKKVTVSLEDAEYEFVKLVWSKMATFSGIKEAREAVIKIDDAIQLAEQGVFTNHEQPLVPVEKKEGN